MTAAGLLAAYGLRVIVIERRSGTSDEPKAISLDDESLRVYQQSGIVDQVLGVIVPGTGTKYYDANNEPLFQARGSVPYRLGYPFKNPFAQPDLERVLAQGLKDHQNVQVLFNTEVVALHQDHQGATVEAIGDNGPLTLNSMYVLGADGGRSTVRELLQIPMKGRSYSDVWLVVDTLEDPHTERYGMHHGDPDRPHVIVPGLDGRCRYEFRLFQGEGEAGQSPDFSLIQRLVSPYRTIEPRQIERVVNYRFNALNAEKWRAGRAFLLGDAAHMMPPFAGQGLNSGVRDAGNLAWKLAAVVRGEASELILDSYEAERKPHAQATIELSVRLGSVAMTTSRRAAQYRDAATRTVLASEEGRAYFEEMRYRPLSKYSRGMVVNLPETQAMDPLVGTAIGQPLAFDMASRSTLRLDEALGRGWAIIGVDVRGDDWAEVRDLQHLMDAPLFNVPLSDHLPEPAAEISVLIDLDNGLYREFSPFTGSFILLRPDRFIAAAWEPGNTSKVLSGVQAWQPAAPATASHEPQLIP